MLIFLFDRILHSVRTASYSIRAYVSKSDPFQSDYKSLVIGAAVLLIAGYLFMLEAICSMVTVW